MSRPRYSHPPRRRPGHVRVAARATCERLAGDGAGHARRPADRPIVLDEEALASDSAQVIGFCGGTTIIVLSDGANTRGLTPLDAVPYAVERGVRVYTIGFGTTSPSQLACSRQQLGAAVLGNGTPFGGGGFDAGGGLGDGRVDPLEFLPLTCDPRGR